MQLELGSFIIDRVEFANRSYLEQKTLFINKAELENLLMEDLTIEQVRIELVAPGENTRVIHVMDAIEPRVKIMGGDNVYPGVAGASVYRCGSGITYRMNGVAVITSCMVPLRKAGGLYIAREGILDIDGPNGELTPFSKTWNIVPVITLKEDQDEEAYELAIRNAGIRAARYLGEILRGQEPDYVKTYSLEGKVDSLPNVVYVNQIESCGLFGRNYFYGMSYDDLLPTLVHPNEFFDGALVNALHSHTAVQTPTYYQTNNPVIEELYRRHGKSLNFCGVILCRGHFEEIDGKHRCANLVAGMAQMLGAEGVVASWECGGNTFMETMLYLKECEKMGIKTVLLTYEHGGVDGTDNPLFYSEPEVDAIISTGSLDRPISFPAVKRVVGGDKIRLAPEEGGRFIPAHEKLELDYRLEAWCSCNNIGIGKLSCDDF
ncbi:MAG: glycine/sarcosine/betaine reductase component B subunit [Bacillota bacterium]|nr:glycine/sarcosine/betaine reductase component B subunit [Bacillota bacterium]